MKMKMGMGTGAVRMRSAAPAGAAGATTAVTEDVVIERKFERHVEGGKTGLLAREGDATEFSKAVGTLLDDFPQRQAMSAAAMAKAEGVHDIAVAAKILDMHLRKLTSPQ